MGSLKEITLRPHQQENKPNTPKIKIRLVQSR